MKEKLLSVLLLGAVVMTTGCGSNVASTQASEMNVETETAAEEAVTETTEEVSPEAGSEATTETGPIQGTFDIHVQGEDWGCVVDKVIINTDQSLSDVSDYVFEVEETKLAMNYETFQMEENTSARDVSEAYLSDAEGNKVDGESDYVTVVMEINPNITGPYVTNYGNFGLNEWSDAYSIAVNVTGGERDFTVDGGYKNVLTSVEVFEFSDFKAADGTEYKYATYDPAETSDTLVVWLHGMGEGGTDTKSVLLNAEVGALAEDDFQKAMGGAYILAPQCPTYWMDADGKGSNYIDGSIQNDGTSAYTESLHELINSYRDEIGASKVIIAGCSNGGFMTMRLAMTYGDEYTAYVPICEAMEDKFITEEDINTLKDLNMFFIYAKNDPLVTPDVYEVPTLARLEKAGAKNLCIYAPEDVHDLSGRFNDAEGNPYQYFGHGSWQYFFNGEAVCDKDGVACWDWMSQQ